MKSITNIFLGLILMVSLTGCATGMFSEKSDTRFQADVERTYDASLAVLHDQNLAVVSKSLSRDKAQIEAQYPDGTPLLIVVKTESIEFVKINIRVGAGGDDHRAYELMKKIESRIKQ